jgi:YD repeat-containing protein
MKHTLSSKLAATGLLLLALETALFAEGNTCANAIPYGPSKPGPCGEQDGANFFSAYSGNASRTVEDLSAFMDGTPSRLGFTRHSNTRLVPMTTSQGRFGREGCWTHNHQWFMRNAGVSTGGQPQVRVGFPDGRDALFTQDIIVSTRWVSAANVSEVVIQNGSEFALHNAQGEIFKFQKRTNTSSGGIFYRIETSEDAAGNAVTYSYNNNNDTLLRKVTNAAGHWIKLTYQNLGAFQQQRVTYATIPYDEAPGQWRELTVTNTTAARFLTLFYDNDFHNAPALPVAEIEFYDQNNVLITGTPFGSDPVYAAGQEHDKAFDGNTSTYYRYAYIRNGYVGLDVGAGVTKQVSRIRYFIPAGVASKVASADFVGMNDLGSTNSVVKEVEIAHSVYNPNLIASEKTVYDYEVLTDSSGWFRWGYLKHVNWNQQSGYTEASYTHTQTHDFTRPLITDISDSRSVGNTPRIKYEYDPSGTLGFVKREKGGISNQTVAETDYDGAHKPKAVYPNGRVVKYQYTNKNGTLIKKTDGLGRVWNMTYDQSGFGHLQSVTDPLGRVTTYTHTNLGNPLTITHPDGSVETYTRDSRERVLTHKLSGPGMDDRLTTYTRDALGRVTRTDYPDGTHEQWTYNALGQMLTHTARDGGVSTMTYDPYFGMMSSTQDATGRMSWSNVDFTLLIDQGIWKVNMIDGLGNTKAYFLNDRGQVTQIEHPDATSAFYTYDAMGNMTAYTNELGNVWSYTHDEFNRVTGATDPLQRTTVYDYSDPATGCCGASAGAGVKPTLITLPSGKKVSFAYDAEWQLIQRTDGFGSPEAATTLWSYDAAGNVTLSLDPMLHQTAYTYNSMDQLLTVTDPLGRVTTHTYDLAGDETQLTRPDGGVISKTYDIMGRLLTSTDPQNQMSVITYDAMGRPLTLQDARGKTHTHEYDLAGRQTKLIYPDGSYEQWTYDAVGRRATSRTRAGQVMTSSYNARGFETDRLWSDNTPDMQLQYEANGRLQFVWQTDTANSRNTSLYYEYDAADQMVRDQVSLQEPAMSGYTANVFSSYDADGNRASLLSPAGEVTYTYTQRNQLKEVIHFNEVLATYAYNPDGTRATKSLLNGTATAYSYDLAGQPTAVNHTGPGATPLKRRDYLYNNMGNRTAMRHDSALWDVYGYDAVDQITSAKYGATSSAGASPASTTTYQYDPVGNRQQMIQSGGTGPVVT